MRSFKPISKVVNLSSESVDYIDTKISVTKPHGTPMESLFVKGIF
jgi:hypothetical protein